MSKVLPVSKFKRKPYVGCIYGRPGVGKTTLLIHSPKPVFIGTEANNNIDGVAGHPEGACQTFDQFLSHFNWATELPDDVCKTIVVDTISEVEALIIQSFTKANENLNTAMKGYGAGREELAKRYFNFFKNFVAKATSKGKNVIFIARVIKQEETDEETGSTYTRTYPKVEKNKSYEFFAGEMDFIFSIKAVAPESTGNQKTEGRMIYTRPSAGSDAKNRYNLKPFYFIPVPSGVNQVFAFQKKAWDDIESSINKFYESKNATPPPANPTTSRSPVHHEELVSRAHNTMLETQKYFDIEVKSIETLRKYSSQQLQEGIDFYLKQLSKVKTNNGVVSQQQQP